MPTLEGLIFIPVALYFFCFRSQFLFPLLILSAVFQASSIVSSGSIGLQPYYCVAALFVLRVFLTGRQPEETNVYKYRFVRLWLAFALISMISAFVLPHIFDGLLVFDPRRSVDENFFQGPVPLHFAMGNVVQSMFLDLNVLVIVAAARSNSSVEHAQKTFLWACYLIIAIIFIQSASFWVGIPFPNWLLNNNPGYSLVQMNRDMLRSSGSFTEPSMAGAVLAGIVAAFLWRYMARRAGIVEVGLAAGACLLVASTSSFIALLVVVTVVIIANPIMRFPWFVRVRTIKRLSIFVAGGLLLATVMFIPPIRSIVLSQTVEKGGSDSALVRMGADLFAFDLLVKTHGLGVGLGSNRPSSLTAALISQVGVIGTLLFVFASVSTLSGIPSRHRWIGMAGLGLVLSMAVGLPDLSFPFVWVIFALAAQAKQNAATIPRRRQEWGN